MIVPTIWEEILNLLSNMSRDQQLKVLDFARSLTVNASVSSKRLWQPYFDIEALDKYCNENGIHPADLSYTEMDQFRLRKRQPREIK